jgi:hypothetical protein
MTWQSGACDTLFDTDQWDQTWVCQLSYLSWLRIQDCSWHERTSLSQVPCS